ncbi:hypothetical protein MATL_G00181020 [Megalops atlanticus]|uniref:Uncharacterized protein n=1 Tax=Megalops atlanticus TaxID=7932 RepID=A0A9D3T001_MEGAT|nr:hypothetical protein MATL_G00181020 [Megalops atlanticus]
MLEQLPTLADQGSTNSAEISGYLQASEHLGFRPPSSYLQMRNRRPFKSNVYGKNKYVFWMSPCLFMLT